MAKFLLKLLVFLLPVGLLYIFPFFVYSLSGEFTSVDTTLQRQAEDESLVFGQAYSYSDQAYKLALVKKSRPEIIALGTSRVMQFRNTFFVDANDFKNAGGSISSTEDLSRFLDKLPKEYSPKVIIVGLDPWLFQEARPETVRSEQATTISKLKNFFIANWREPYADYFSGKFSLHSLVENNRKKEAIGLNALVNGNGFLPDGSYLYGEVLANPDRDTILQEGIALAKTKAETRQDLEYGVTISANSLSSLKDFLEQSRKRDIHVVGFIPPSPHTVYIALTEASDAYSKTVSSLPITLKNMFTTYGYSFYDYSDSAHGLIPDNEFIDSSHATDKAAFKMLIDMTKHDITLVKYVNIQGAQPSINPLDKPGDTRELSSPKKSL